MKNQSTMKKSNIILTNILILAAGILFVLLHHRENVMEWVVIISGILFALTGLLNIFVVSKDRNDNDEHEQKRPSSHISIAWFCSVAAIILGVLMVITPHTFLSIVAYIFAVALFAGASFHIYMLARGLKPVTLPVWIYSLPVALIVISVVMFFLTAESQNLVLLLSGIGLILFSATTFIEIISLALLKKSPLPIHA